MVKPADAKKNPRWHSPLNILPRRRPTRRLLTALLLSTLVLPALAADRQTAADGAAETLRHAVKGRFLIGTAVMSRQLDNSATAELVARQFDCLTAENEFKPQSLQPRPGKFKFAAADKIIDFAQRHDMKVVGHNLCWHSQTPAWMFHDENGKPLPRDAALKNLKDHIDGIVKHFKGKVIGWDVVNEAISNAGDDYLRDTPARRHRRRLPGQSLRVRACGRPGRRAVLQRLQQ